MKSPFKVMSTAALAAAVAVPTLSVPAADAAESTSFQSVALETEDGSIVTVSFSAYAEAKTFGSGELGEFVESADVVAVSAEEGKFVTIRTLAMAKIENPDADTISLLNDLDEEEENLVADEDVADYTAWEDMGEDAAPVVESVSAINLAQFEVEFNQAVDAESLSLDNFDLSGAAQASLENGDVSLSEDGMTATVTLGTVADQQEELEVTVDGVTDLDGNEFEEMTETVTFVDQTIPEVEAMEVVGKDTIKVSFTEPMDVDGLTRSDRRAGFSLEDSSGKTIYVDDVTFAQNNTEANVTFYSDLDEETYSLTVNNKYKDYAGYTVVKETADLDVVVDDEAPEVVDVKSAKPYETTLVFNEDINVTGDLTDFYHTNDNLTASNTSVDGNELTIEFNKADKMPAGTVYLYIKDGAVEDLWGNSNDQQRRVEVNVTGDEVAPTVEKVAASAQDTLKVTFNEALDSTSAQDEDNYTILKDGEEVDGLVRSASYSDKVVTLQLRDNVSGDYTVVVDNVKDLYDNDIDKESIDFNVEDVTKPEFSDFGSTLYETTQTVNSNPEVVSQSLVVDFGEAMSTDGEYSVTDLDKYVIGMQPNTNTEAAPSWGAQQDVNLSDISSGISIKSLDNDSKVEITLDTLEAGYKITDSTIDLARVADASGNKTDMLASTVAISAESTIGADSFEVVSSNEAKLTLADQLVDFDAGDFHLETTGATAVGEWAAEEEVVDGQTVVTFTLLDGAFDADGTVLVDDDNDDSTALVDTNEKLQVTTTGTIDSENRFGSQVEILAAANVDADDSVNPALAQNANGEYLITDNNDDTFTLNFTEPVYTGDNTLAATDLDVTADGDELVAGDDYEVTFGVGSGNASNTATLTLKGDYEGFDGDLTVATDANVNYIKDVAGNMLADIDNADVDVDGYAAFTSTSINDTNTEITLNLDEVAYASASQTGALDSTDFSVSFTTRGDSDESVSVTSVSHTAGSATATFNVSVSGTIDGDEEITITPASGSDIYDENGNATVATEAITVTPSPDTTAPAAVQGLSASQNPADDPEVEQTINSVELSWTASTSADVAGYDVYRYAGNDQAFDGTATPIATDVSVTSYSDGTITEGDSYTYYVVAKDASNNQQESAGVNASVTDVDNAPAQVTTFNATDEAGSSNVNLSWDASTATDFDHYELYQGTSDQGTPVNTSLTTESAVYDATGQGGNTLDFAVYAVDSTGNKSAVSTTSVTVDETN